MPAPIPNMVSQNMPAKTAISTHPMPCMIVQSTAAIEPA